MPEVHNKNMVFSKIVMTNFNEKLQKILFIFYSEIQIIKDGFKKFKILNPDSLGLT